MIESKSTSHYGLPQKPGRSMSRVEILSGAAWFFIEKNVGRKLILNSRRHAGPREKMTLPCNSICAGWSRSFCRERNRPWKKAERALRRTEYPVAIRDLIAQLRQMPGVGPRSAERIALWMVRARDDHPEQIARAIAETRQAIRPCKLCGFFATGEICEICADSSRSTELLCVIEQPTDILPLEKTNAFRGRYH